MTELIKSTSEIYPVAIVNTWIHIIHTIPLPKKCSTGEMSTQMRIYSFDEIELMQSTGIKDIEGKEIYEGDIIEYTSPINEKKPLRSPVFYQNSSYRCAEIGATGPQTLQGIFQFFMRQHVIGNIYQNKTLLDEQSYYKRTKMEKLLND